MPSPNNEKDFQDLYSRYFDDIARYCLRRLNVDDAPDAASEVFAVAWRKQASVPSGDEALPWLYGVARNVVRNAQRAGRRSLRLRAKLNAQPRYAEADVEVQVILGEELRVMATALTRLRSDDQELVRLRSYEGLTVPEISVVLGCSPEAAKKRVARALKRLRKAAGADLPGRAGRSPVQSQEEVSDER